jgi:hypothetical protein
VVVVEEKSVVGRERRGMEMFRPCQQQGGGAVRRQATVGVCLFRNSKAGRLVTVGAIFLACSYFVAAISVPSAHCPGVLLQWRNLRSCVHKARKRRGPGGVVRATGSMREKVTSIRLAMTTPRFAFR